MNALHFIDFGLDEIFLFGSLYLLTFQFFYDRKCHSFLYNEHIINYFDLISVLCERSHFRTQGNAQISGVKQLKKEITQHEHAHTQAQASGHLSQPQA